MGDALKILVAADVDPSNVIGGAERALDGQLRELARRGHIIIVMARQTAGKPTSEDTGAGYRVVRYPMGSTMGPSELLRTLRTIARLANTLMRSEAPDLIYVQQPLAGAGVLMSTLGRRLPAAYQFHSPWSDEYRLRLPRAAGNVSDPSSFRLTPAEQVKSNLRKLIERITVRRSKTVLTLSRFMRDRCMVLHRVPESRFAIVPGGVDTDHFNHHIDRCGYRRRLEIEHDENLLLSVRNLEPRMGLGNLISAMPEILRSNPKTVCIIGGDGALAASLKAQAIGLKLGDRIRFTGFIAEQDLPGYYAAADLFILPTTALEGFGMVTVEALACGTPVLGTPVGATPEILGILDNDLLMAGVEPEHIAASAVALMSRSHDARETLRSRCREFAEKNYSWPAVTNGIETALHEVAKHV